jgi:hypothetical protein
LTILSRKALIQKKPCFARSYALNKAHICHF